jgi:hypothetical protein
MRTVLLCLLWTLVAFGNQQKSSTPTSVSEKLVHFTPTGCVYSSTGAHTFTTLNVTLTADIYDCPIYPNLTCTYAVDSVDNVQEMICLTPNLAQPQIIPVECVRNISFFWAGGGTRLFLDGTTLASTDVYECGHLHGGLGCIWYSHASGRGDLICYDYF